MSQILKCSLVLLVGIAACSGPQEPAVDTEAAGVALRTAAQAYHDVVLVMDTEAIASFYMTDAVSYPPNEPTVRGQVAFEEFAEGFAAAPGLQMEFGSIYAVVAASGDMGYTFAEGQATVDGPDGAPVTETLRDFHLWVRDSDGAWKIMVDIWNSPDPLPEGGM